MVTSEYAMLPPPMHLTSARSAARRARAEPYKTADGRDICKRFLRGPLLCKSKHCRFAHEMPAPEGSGVESLLEGLRIGRAAFASAQDCAYFD